MALNEELKPTKFGVKLTDEQINTIVDLGQSFYEKCGIRPNVIRSFKLDYDTIVKVLNKMIETGDNFAKVYIQLYFGDIRERYKFDIKRNKSIN